MTRKALLTSTAISPLENELLTRPDEFERERRLADMVYRGCKTANRLAQRGEGSTIVLSGPAGVVRVETLLPPQSA